MATRIDELIASLKEGGGLAEAELERADHGLAAERGAAVVRLVETETIGDAEQARELRARLGEQAGVLVLGEAGAELIEALGGSAPLGLLPTDTPVEVVANALGGLLERVELRARAVQRTALLDRTRYERAELVDIARAITRERDIDTLLGLILEKSRYITGADAGSIYVVEGEADAPGGRRMRFKLSQNDSMSYESREFVMPVSKESMAGAAVLTRTSINVADVYEADSDPSLPYGFDESFDERTGYRTVSMLSVPMISAQDEVIGVIQLINKKRAPRERLKPGEENRDRVIPFDERSEELAAALAAQAGIALENALLYEEIRVIFEGFVRASMQAIEQRDPTTSGHSLRVNLLSCTLAEKVDRIDSGPYREAHFSRRDLKELEYAALLHDFGKIGVREEVLVKAKKLHPHEREAVRTRIDFALKSAEADLFREKLDLVERGAGASDLAAADERHRMRRDELLDAWAFIERANEPTVLSEGDFSRLARIGAMSYLDLQGAQHPLLSRSEVIALEIKRGSLSPAEMDEIRTHVVHTYNFLIQIPWGKSLRRVPEIAGAHHEKLNGTGYPSGVPATEIPLQSKIMTVADIYDALTASDRPYKKAVPHERALQILGFEVKDGNLDAELVRIFREADVPRVLG